PSNLVRLLGLQDAPRSTLRHESIGQRLGTLLSEIGLSVQSKEREAVHLETLGAHWQSERDSLSGVDVNEEMLAMLRYQQAYQSVARFVSSVSDTVEILLELAR
ncbi:MAG: hypothetical protein KDA75_13230, partial [Planctomycetaceae bacterium]|nr:hypothetical protein [Planctomycetaceae bacterium]